MNTNFIVPTNILNRLNTILETYNTNTNSIVENVDITKIENIKENEKNNTIIKKVKKIKNEEISKTAIDMNYKVYYKNKSALQKFKLFEIKYIAKKNGLKFSGTKKILIERIKEFYLRTYNTVKIQSIVRRWFVLFSIKNRGPAFKNRSICTNDTDFVSLEPITEIPNEVFYSYKDSKGFTYGFNVSSLIETLKIKGTLNNPYNRELINGESIKKIIQIYNICFIIYPNFEKENIRLSNKAINQYLQSSESQQSSQQGLTNIRETNRQHEDGQTRRRLPGYIRNDANNTNNNRDNENLMNNQYNNITMYSTFLNTAQLTTEQETRILRLNELRNLTISQRINNLFIEIDSLGNYTQASWFENLSYNDYILLYRTLYDIWYFQGNIERSVRHNVCPFQTPFYNIHNILRNRTNYIIDQIREACLVTFENLTYTGIDDDHRRLGVFHALTALTVSSVGARTAMPWLYESIAF